jgi:hypothetical protein
MRSIALVSLALAVGGVWPACSGGGTKGGQQTGAAGAAAGGSGSGGGSAGTSGGAGATAGTTGAGGSGGAGTGGSDVSGTSGTGTGGAGGGAGASPADGSAGSTDAGEQPEAGTKSCAGNAISLGANGSGMDSDAARARVVIDLLTDLPIGNADRTIEFWAYIKPTDWVGEKNEIYVYGDLGVNTGAFGLDFGTFEVTGMPGNHATLNPVTGGGFNDDSRNDLGLTSASSQWVHVAMTWDGIVVRTYVNGALKITSKGTGGATKLATVASALTIGCNPPYYNCFNGYYDDFRVWKTARSDAEIAANYKKTLKGDEAGLVGYWKFDEAPDATTAADSVTAAGHTAHPGMLLSAMPQQHPTFVTPNPPAPIACP